MEKFDEKGIPGMPHVTVVELDTILTIFKRVDAII
jgi:hypothetical protein